MMMHTRRHSLAVAILAIALPATGCGTFGIGGSSAGPDDGSSADPADLNVVGENEDGRAAVGIGHLDVVFLVPKGTTLAPAKETDNSAYYVLKDGTGPTFFSIDRDKNRYYDSVGDYVDKSRKKFDDFEEGTREEVSNGWDASNTYNDPKYGQNMNYFGQFKVGSEVYRCQLYGRASKSQVEIGKSMCRSLAVGFVPNPDSLPTLEEAIKAEEGK